jgi:protein KRI1
VTIRQAALESALHTASRSPSPAPLTHVEEQHALREEIVSHFRNAVSEEEDDDDDDTLLVPREKTKEEAEREDEEYREFLKREVGGDLDALVTVQEDTLGVWEASEDDPKRKEKTKPTKGNKKGRRDADHEFLMK